MGSRYVSPTESRYAPIELELLGVTWAVKKCRLYLLGRQTFEIIVDHRPLVGILDRKTLDQIENPRIQRMKESLSLYSFTTKWICGKQHKIADALSRAPVNQPDATDEEKLTQNEFHLRQVIGSQTSESSGNEDISLKRLETNSLQDEDYQLLKDAVLKGFPKSRDKTHPSLLAYWNIRNELSIDGNLVLYGHRIVVPKIPGMKSYKEFIAHTKE